MKILTANIVLLCILLLVSEGTSLLYPRESESRELKDLSGRWTFRVDDSSDRNQGFREQWWTKPLRLSGEVTEMAVPASYNDIVQNRSVRDFVGWAWYECEFFAPASWKSDLRVWLRVGSAHYNSIVYLNSEKIMEHSGGHLPFETEVSSNLQFGTRNRLTIAINNTLTPNTLPPGTIKHYDEKDGYPSGLFTQEYTFDFFNYAGLHRPVKLYTTPRVYIADISTSFTVSSDLAQSTVKFEVQGGGASSQASIQTRVNLIDREGNAVATATGQSGTLNLMNQNLWWPVGMNETVAYMHIFEVLLTADGITDTYRLPIGIRSVRVDGTRFLINGRSFYFHGFGRHEDWNIRGKGMDWSMIIKDFNLIDWVGANSFRTSHYPYSEEIMHMCDERGIVVIDECPAVGMRDADNFVNKTLEHHLAVMKELVSRDRNHPSVVMWSIANEPASNLAPAGPYFKTVLDYTRSLDSTRPVTFVCNEGYNVDLATPYVDVVSLNLYEGWYSDHGLTEVIQGRVENYFNHWHQTRPTKPIIHMEWGAGVVAGFHMNPTLMWTESYLVSTMTEHFRAFDSLRSMTSPYFVGEMIWNFADFNTAQSNTRALGNRKGIFTRDRQPKWPAYYIRERYRALLNSTKPSYSDPKTLKLQFERNEHDIV